MFLTQSGGGGGGEVLATAPILENDWQLICFVTVLKLYGFKWLLCAFKRSFIYHLLAFLLLFYDFEQNINFWAHENRNGPIRAKLLICSLWLRLLQCPDT